MDRYRVCVADDSPEVTAMLCHSLERYNYEVVGAGNGEEALAACAEGKVDLILLDIAMPGIDGYEVCKRLKADPVTRDIEVIFVTAKDAPEDRSYGMSLGAAAYITKPFNLPMVMVHVDGALRKRAIQQHIRANPDVVAEVPHTDLLTGLRTRHYLLQRLQEEVEESHRYHFPLSCAVFDVDTISPVDAGRGTMPIDDLLVDIAIILRSNTRACDVIGRCDQTEFAVILPHTPLDSGLSFARRILDDVSTTTFATPSYPTRATLSGAVVACCNGAATGADFVFSEAMRGLLKAKSLSDGRLIARDLFPAEKSQ